MAFLLGKTFEQIFNPVLTQGLLMYMLLVFVKLTQAGVIRKDRLLKKKKEKKKENTSIDGL